MNFGVKLTGTVVTALALLAGSASAASAAVGPGHPISGTCFESGAWFTSNNVRATSPGSNSVAVTFGQAPTKGVAFYIYDYQTGFPHGVIFAPPTARQWLALGDMGGGKQFVNNFRLEVSGQQSNYSFTGSESY
jgi:hypothetical protein